jgi:ABC-type Fe3+ transport system substrate-binding protein
MPVCLLIFSVRADRRYREFLPGETRTMKQRQLRSLSSCLVAVVCAAFIGSLHLTVTPAAAASPTPERFGKTFAEIVSLAKKEGKVRFTSGTPDERQAKSFFKGFREKYPEINVEYTRATPRTASETILAELLSGQVQYDLVTVLDTLIPKYKKTGVLAGPFDWASLFGIRGVYISPDRYFVGAGASTDALVYNTKMVPPERVPRRWEDCLDPYWRGKFVVDSRGGSFVRMYPLWGKEKLLDFARRLAANKPVWIAGNSDAVMLIANGEYPMMCGAFYSSSIRIVSRAGDSSIGLIIPKEVGANLYATMGVVKNARYPNAALLLAGYLASDEGQKAYRGVSRDSPFDEGSEFGKRIKEAGAKVIFSGWEFTPEQEAEVVNLVLQAWGFRK